MNKQRVVIEDFRTTEEVKQTIGFVVATAEYVSSLDDDFHWKKAAVAAAFGSKCNYKDIVKKFVDRKDFKRVRIAHGVKLKTGRHYRTKGVDRVIIHKFGTFL